MSTTSIVPAPPAGWYANPEGSGQRYWDGGHWTEHFSEEPPPPGMPQAALAAVKERAGMAVTALCFGLAAVAAGLAMYILFWLAWVLGLVAIVLGLVARKGSRRAMARWSVVLGVGALVLGGVGAAKVSKAASDLQNSANQLNSYSTCVQNAQTADQLSQC